MLLTNQHKTVQLQQFYTANQNLRNTPKELKDMLKMVVDCPQIV